MIDYWNFIKYVTLKMFDDFEKINVKRYKPENFTPLPWWIFNLDIAIKADCHSLKF